MLDMLCTFNMPNIRCVLWFWAWSLPKTSGYLAGTLPWLVIACIFSSHMQCAASGCSQAGLRKCGRCNQVSYCFLVEKFAKKWKKMEKPTPLIQWFAKNAWAMKKIRVIILPVAFVETIGTTNGNLMFFCWNLKQSGLDSGVSFQSLCSYSRWFCSEPHVLPILRSSITMPVRPGVIIWFMSARKSPILTGRSFLVGGLKYFYFHPYLGKVSNLTNIFQMGWNQQLVSTG